MPVPMNPSMVSETQLLCQTFLLSVTKCQYYIPFLKNDFSNAKYQAFAAVRARPSSGQLPNFFDVTTSYFSVDRVAVQENVTSHAYRTAPEMTPAVVPTWRQHIQLLWQCNMLYCVKNTNNKCESLYCLMSLFLFTVVIMVCVRRSHVPHGTVVD